MSLFDPDVAYEDMNLPDHVGEIYHGHEGVIRAAERWTEPFEWMVVELEEIIDARDHLVSFHRWRAKAQHSGIEINEPLVYRWIFRDGKVIHFRSLGPEEADLVAALRQQAMSHPNVELVRRALEAANVGGVEAALAFYPPDVVFYAIAAWAEDAEYRGHDGVRELNAIFTNAFEDFAWDVLEIRGVGERVLVLTDMTGRIKGSAAAIRERYAVVCSDFRDGTFGEVRFFQNWQQALEATGLADG